MRPPACMAQRRTRIGLYCLVAQALLMLVVVWAMMGSVVSAPRTTVSTGATIAVLLTFGITFGALAMNLVGRLPAVAVGAFISLLFGALLQFYFPDAAARYLFGKLDTLI